MKVTYFGHSCFQVEIAGKKILFDPFIRENPLAGNIDVKAIKPDVILISHGHGDHMADAIEIANQSGALIISNFEIVTWMGKKGVSNTHGMNFGGSKKFDWGKVKMVVALHSSVLPDGTYGGNPGGFVVESEEGNFYFAGDTALTLDFKLIGERHKLDFAFLPIGDNFTMGVEDAVVCADFVRSDKVIGMHYDTYPVIKIDKESAKAQFKAAGRELYLLEIGETRDI
jgi:L-ascorbate metabolism protein UlaG (beta-lactamase superfamily)